MEMHTETNLSVVKSPTIFSDAVEKEALVNISAGKPKLYNQSTKKCTMTLTLDSGNPIAEMYCAICFSNMKNIFKVIPCGFNCHSKIWESYSYVH